MKASFTGKYDKDRAVAGGSATVAFKAADLKLKASLTDATGFKDGLLTGLAIGVEKPGCFIIDYEVPEEDFRFQFLNTVRIADKPLDFMYSHSRGKNRTMLDGTLVIDSANKVSANHVLGSRSCKLKYTYVHGGLTCFEPSYDWAKNSWDFAVSRRVYGDDVFKASYQTWTQNLKLEYSRRSKFNSLFKITAAVNLAEETKKLKLDTEMTWDLIF